MLIPRLLDRLLRVPHVAATQVAVALGRLARQGGLAAPARPPRPRLVLLQIDGLSGGRLERALADGAMPRLAGRLASGRLRLRRLRAATPPSTPVFQAGLLYGSCLELPGFGWYDRVLGRQVRMDLAEDIAAIERELTLRATAPLLLGGHGYGTIWSGGASDLVFNVLRWGLHAEAFGLPGAADLRRDLYDRLSSLATVATVGARLGGRLLAELGAGAIDLARFFRQHGTTRFEWRFLYMRLFASVILRDVASHGAALDVLRGVPVIYVDYLDYDEYAHRRGPDSETALVNLRGIDAAVERVARAVDAVPEYTYELYLLSDHGQSATVPFERVMGEDLATFVLGRVVADAARGETTPAGAIRELVRARTLRFWTRSLRPWMRSLVEPLVQSEERRVARRLRAAWQALAPVEIVTGGSIAHLYLDRDSGPLTVDAIERRWPRLVAALRVAAGVGLMVGRGPGGPVVYHRGLRAPLGEGDVLDGSEPQRALGPPLLDAHLRAAVSSPRAGDLVLFGAFAPSGNVAFDFELGSHGGIHPEELDQFLIHPGDVDFDAGDVEGGVNAEAFHRFFRARHGHGPGGQRGGEAAA